MVILSAYYNVKWGGIALRERTYQELFWEGEFGDSYIQRNSEGLLASKINLFTKIFSRTSGEVRSVLEFGANIGLNLQAISCLYPSMDITAVEINQKAFYQLNELDYVNAHKASIFDFEPSKLYDFVFTSGMLIHINPSLLHDAYDKIYYTSSKYIMLFEYYNPTPVEVNYRGNTQVLFKRDFAGELLDRFSDLLLIDYGFIYHRDNNFPLDDGTWFLLEKV